MQYNSSPSVNSTSVFIDYFYHKYLSLLDTDISLSEQTFYALVDQEEMPYAATDAIDLANEVLILYKDEPLFDRTPMAVEFFCFMSFPDDEGHFNSLTAAGIERLSSDAAAVYLKKRITHSPNLYSISRYGHILWEFHKSFQHVKIAIESYLQVAGYCLSKLSNDEKSFSPFKQSFQQALILSLNLKYESGVSGATSILEKFIQTRTELWMKEMIIDHLLSKAKKILKAVDLSPFVEEVKGNPVLKGYFQAKEIHLCAIKVSNYYKTEDAPLLYEQLGDKIRADANGRKDDKTGLVVIPHLAEAMKYYRFARADEKFKETANELALFKKKRKPFARVRIPLSDTLGVQLFAMNERFIKWISAVPAEARLVVLGRDNSFLPRFGASAAVHNSRSLTSLFTVYQFDKNQNSKLLKDRAKPKNDADTTYHAQFQLTAKQIIVTIMHELIKSRQLTVEKMDEHFKNNWIGIIHQAETDGKSTPICFYDYIRPALIHYLEQVTKSLTNSGDADFIVCIDAMVIRLEFLLRSLFKLKEISTTTIDTASNELREIYLPELLERSKELKVLADQEYQVLNYLYTKSGLDLRNNIAHGYFDIKSYTIELADMVFWSIVKLGEHLFPEFNIDIQVHKNAKKT